jgi:hypothetical protein
MYVHTDYTGQGVHQLDDCIDKIINNADDRRIVMSAWTQSTPKCTKVLRTWVSEFLSTLSFALQTKIAPQLKKSNIRPMLLFDG